jgi:uncharacterized iron-regulated protein
MAKTLFNWLHIAHEPYSFNPKQYVHSPPHYRLQCLEPRVPKHNSQQPSPPFGEKFTKSNSPQPPSSLPRFNNDETRQKNISAEEMEYLNNGDGNYFAGSSRREAILKPLLALGVSSLPSIATARAENAPVVSLKKTLQLEPNNNKDPGSITNSSSNDNNKVNSRVYDATVIGEPVAIGKERGRVWTKLLGARVVYLGEAENVPDPDDKGIELEIVQNLRDKCFEQQRPISLALQAFPSNLQPQLDQYMSSRINDNDLKSFVSHWPAQRWKEYMPLLHYCCKNGVQLIACGAPLEIIRTVQSEGVQGLSEVDRRKYAPPAGAGFVTNSSSVSRRLSLYNVLPQASFSFGAASYLFAQARVVEDYIMSQIVTQAIVDGGSAGLLIVITGSSHVLLGTRGGGLPARISKKTPKKSQVAVLLNPERQHIRKEGEAPVADFLWYSAAKPCIRNCFDRAEIARIMDASSRRRDTLPQDIQKGLDLGLVPPEVLQSFFDLEQQPFIAELTHHFQGFRERWLANPRIFQRLALEETICITATLMAQYEKRKERFMEELDYVISDTLRSAVVSFFAVWLPAPTLSFLSYEENTNTSWTIEGLKGLLGSLPENAFQRNSLGQNWDFGARGAAVLMGGLKLFCVGFLSSISTVSITNTLFSIRQQWSPGVEKHNINVQYPVFKTAFVYGCFLGTSANLRYQFVAGIVEHWVADYLLASQPLLGDIISFLARVINSYFGTQQWIDLARHIGLQQSKVEPENFEDKVLDSPRAEGKKTNPADAKHVKHQEVGSLD